MQATLTIDIKGSVKLPAKLRRVVGLKAPGQLIAEITGQGLLLRPAVTMPVEVFAVQREQEFNEAEAELTVVLTQIRRMR